MSSNLVSPISFRPLQRSDLPLLQQWISAPHVALWWNESAETGVLEAKYGARIDGLEPTHVFITSLESRPVGWIQWYLWSDYQQHAQQLGAEPGSAGIDLALGDPTFTGHGFGPLIITEFLTHIVFTNKAVNAIVADPDERNRRSLRAFQKAGFAVTNTVHLAGETGTRKVVRLNRHDLTNPNSPTHQIAS